MTCPALSADFDPTDPDLYTQRLPLEEFAELRRTAPVKWIPQTSRVSNFGDDGYWLVTRHADVKEVSTKPEIYSTNRNTAIIRFGEGIQLDTIDAQKLIMVNIDPPEHTRLRSIVQRGFTPRAINALKDTLTERAARIVGEAAKAGTGDFVTQIACELPLQAIAELIGVPQDDRGKIFAWSNQMLGYDDPDYAENSSVGEQAAAEIMMYSMGMAEERKACPAQDIVSRLVAAESEGSLSSDEFGFFVLLLAVAGNETTRNAITHGMLAFFDNPDQWDLYKASRPETTADEIIRYSSPVMAFQRTATEDTVLGGQEIKEGQRVGIFYSSANFDGDVFDNPDKFDITRDPNPHLGFGGGGPHFCLGASLARMEINLMFNAIAEAMPNIAKAAEPRRLRHAWINGIKELQVDYTG
ncbi:cytochrome P450 [Yinghuangia sp. ASG 101]|uniref:cytochrome P450 n=1 Tax=Yinghuangia sp. ASG 101 TaxID=2896848 RepID=UPI001E38C90A|nr:cytochrome P450 [Yinghuangia sp. ASG 101]UGQ12860.1 cytochrome P450 [Yinghuangia sp. ASG 101]